MLCLRGTSNGPGHVSVTSQSSTKTAKRRITQTKPHDSSGTLVFWCQRCLRNLTGVTPYGGAKCRLVGQNRRKSPILTHPTCIWCPCRGWPRSNFVEIFGNKKTRVPGLSWGVVCVILRFAVLVEHRFVTDRQTDRQTDRHRAMAGTADA